MKKVKEREGEGAISFGNSLHIALVVPPPVHGLFFFLL